MSRVHRYFLKIAYRGTKYHGWQKQEGQPTVQEALENAISLLLRKKIEVLGCGRTDTGVHAAEYYLHFDSDVELEGDRFVYKLNGILDLDIAVNELIPVQIDAHARFDATSRTYRYFIHQQKNPFLNDTSSFVAEKLDLNIMNEAATLLIAHKNFESFAKTGSYVGNYNCDIFTAFWSLSEGQLIFEITANRFLRNMVRAVVGTMLQVGMGKISLVDFVKIIESNNRSNAGKSVDAKGLFLFRIKYPYLQ